MGNVIDIITIDGNWGGHGDYNVSKVSVANHKKGKGDYSLSSIASFISVSEVIQQAKQGNVWKDKYAGANII